MTNVNDKSAPHDVRISCKEIQGLLFDYVSRELGGGRTDLIREHLRRCSNCQAAAADTQNTLDLLNSGSHRWDDFPDRLSDERRARIVFAFSHPVLNWIYRRHVMVSILVTAIALAVLLGLLYHARIHRSLTSDAGVPVTIGEFRQEGTEPSGQPALDGAE